MERARIEDVQNFFGPATVKRSLSRALDTTELAINYFELEPGDALSFGYHRHPGQEEVFIVHAGTITFETEDGSVEVGSDEAVRFGPGEYQHGVNTGGDRARVIALGAPRAAGDAEILRDCPNCGERTRQTVEMADGRDALVTRCDDCGTVTGRFVHGEVDIEAA